MASIVSVIESSQVEHDREARRSLHLKLGVFHELFVHGMAGLKV